jgi:hypothetical protein
MRHLKSYNESIRDFLKPKSENETEKEFKNMTPEQILRSSSKFGYMKGVKSALKMGTETSLSLMDACRYGHQDIAFEILNQGHEYDESVYNYCFRWACMNGFIDLVKKFIKEQRVDPSMDNNACLYVAKSYEYSDIIEELMKDYRVRVYEEMERSMEQKNKNY